ncbi:MAG: DUF296 domain-containing protein [Mycoplasma sp.]|nr:DUF296 domain-containing protein [Mycoplasma sp.]
MQSKKIGNTWVLKISVGEKIAESLDLFIKDKNIKFAKITGIGAGKDIKLGYLDQKTKEYTSKVFAGTYEITSIIGSIGGEEPSWHIHVSMSDDNYNLFGGHFYDATITGVAELFIEEVGDKKVIRELQGKDLIPTWNLEK